MPNLAITLKHEITRLARKELRSETDALKKAVASYRSEIAALKRRLVALEKQQKRTSKAVPAAPSADQPSKKDQRFSAKGFAMHRARLGLSAADYGKLLGVSSLSVYKWESGQVRPRARHIPVIAALRSIGKREATKRLEQLSN